MPVDATALRQELNAGEDVTNQQLQDCVDFAAALVDSYIADNLDDPTVVPDAAKNRAILRTAVDDFNASQAPNGILNQEFNTGSGDVVTAPLRVNRDPLAAARGLLSLWVIPVVG